MCGTCEVYSLNVQVSRKVEEQRDGAARLAIVAVAQLQAAGGGGKAHVSAAVVCIFYCVTISAVQQIGMATG